MPPKARKSFTTTEHVQRVLAAEHRFWAKVSRTHGCWAWVAGVSRFGYGAFGIKLGSRWVAEEAHNVAWVLYTREPIPADRFVLHTCDNPPCVKREHLYLGTGSDNAKDMTSRGRRFIPPQPRGEQKGAARLSEAKVREIKRLLAAGILSRGSIGKMFGVSKSTIRDIDYGLVWAFVEAE